MKETKSRIGASKKILSKSKIKNTNFGETFDKTVIVSGDGDYKMLVDFLIEENRFEKVLFPNQKRASSLYKKINLKYRVDLNTESIIKKIGKQKEKGFLGN